MNRLRDFFAPDVGRLRRPEISGSEMAGMNVLRGADAEEVNQTLMRSVERRQRLTDQERHMEIGRLAQLAEQLGIPFDDKS